MTDRRDRPVRLGSHTTAAEAASISLVHDTQEELSRALNSLHGQEMEGALDRFIGYSARSMNRALDSYLLLRRSGRFDASKLLIRPMIEFWFRLQAVHKKPQLFYRIMFTERQSCLIWARAFARHVGETFNEEAEESDWNHLRQHCASTIEGCDMTDKKILVKDLAAAGGLQKYYDTYYRTYCMFTHGHLQAAIGDFDPGTDPEDNLIVCVCGMSAIAAAASAGATLSPASSSLRARLAELAKPTE